MSITTLLRSCPMALILAYTSPALAQPSIENAINQPMDASNPMLFPTSTHAADTRAAAANSNVSSDAANSLAPLPPLTINPEDLVGHFTPEEIIRLRETTHQQQRASAHKPYKTIPQTRTISVNLSPGAKIPVVYTAPMETTALVFLDSTGKPWPIAQAPTMSNKDFQAEVAATKSSLLVSTLGTHAQGNAIVYLEGLATPVIIQLDHAPEKKKKRKVDIRVGVRVPGRGPNAAPLSYGTPKIALYDDALQGFLDGVPPTGASQIKTQQDVDVQVWKYNQSLFVRTPLIIRTAFESSISSGDGTHVYKIPLTPYVTLSDKGRPVTLELNI